MGILAFQTVSCAQQAKALKKNKTGLPTVVIVTTGGTIAEKDDPKTGAAVPAVSGSRLIDAVPEIRKIAKVKVFSLCNIDSSHMSPAIWAKLSAKLDELLSNPKVKGAVVTHGTDTMAEGSFFVDITLKSTKPVVFVGAMRDASSPYSDGPPNLLDAVRQVCSAEAENWGVTLTMNQYINAPFYVRKTQTTNVQTFSSGEKGYLGYIAEKKIFRINEKVHKIKLPLPEKLPKVALCFAYSGADGSLVRYAADSGNRGIVVEAVGAGNVNPDVYKAILYALKKNISVVITTNVLNGNVLPIYGGQGGGATLEKDGAILGGSLDSRKARLLLMLALPVTNGDIGKLRKIFEY